MSQHLAEEQRQTEAHNWNPDQSIAENVLREHMPYTYLAWIFSGLSEEELFFGPRTVRRVTISGPVDVEVWLDDFFDRYLNVFLMRNNEDTVTCLPVDKNFRILIRAEKPSAINYYDVFWNPAETLGSSDKIHTGNVSEGEYVLDVSHDLPLPDLMTAQGDPAGLIALDFDYSPTAEMAAEASSANHFTVQQVIALLFNTILFLLVILLGSLGIFIVHAVKKKKTGQTYSPWYVIGPHMAIVYLLLVVSRFVSVNMFSIANAEIVNAALITGVIFLLALRGLLRNRCLINLIICIVFLACTVVNFLLFKNNRLLTSSVWHFVIYCVLIVIAVNLAAATFFVPNKKKQ